jgi:hypothetical protein
MVLALPPLNGPIFLHCKFLKMESGTGLTDGVDAIGDTAFFRCAVAPKVMNIRQTRNMFFIFVFYTDDE